VRRRLQHRLEQACRSAACTCSRATSIAYLNIDEVIHIIRTEEEPKTALMARFGITDVQAEAILDLKLRNLAQASRK
jgi:topoisomerase-4 subunit A